MNINKDQPTAFYELEVERPKLKSKIERLHYNNQKYDNIL
jgi:hypothetical protein